MTTIYWIGDDGYTIPLDGTAGITLTKESTLGLYELPNDLSIQARVTGDGGVLTSLRRSPRSLSLGLLVEGWPVAVTWSDMLASLMVGGVLMSAVEGRVRTLHQVVLEGPSPSMLGLDLLQVEADHIPVSLIALDPWWYGQAQVVTVPLTSTSTAFDAPIAFDAAVPFNGGASISVTVEGHTRVAPRFLIVGPTTNVTVSNGTVLFEVTRDLAAGDIVEIDTRPGSRGPHLGSDMVTGSTPGLVDWSLLSEASRLFDLPVGTSPLMFGATGTNADSKLQVVWEPRWLTP